jgi:hypothetical protein
MNTHSTRSRILRKAARSLSLGLALGLAPALIGCGRAAESPSRDIAATVDKLAAPPGGTIARVGPYTIGAQAFRNAYAEAVEAEPAATRAAAVPPGFVSCVERLASIAKTLNLTLPTRAQRAAKCKERYEASRDEILSRAIPRLWVAAEARELGLPVRLAGEDELIGPRLQAESGRLAKLIGQDVLAPLSKLSRTQLRSYYESHSRLFAVPAQRDLRIVRVASKAAAERTKREIRSGRTFAGAARGLQRQPQMSVHGFVPRYEWGDFREPVLNEAIFAAKPHVLEGPLRVSALYGYFIFEVLHDYPRHQRPFASVERTVLAQLPGKMRQERLDSFVRSWTARWLAKTSCSFGYVVEACGEARSTPSQVATGMGAIFR